MLPLNEEVAPLSPLVSLGFRPQVSPSYSTGSTHLHAENGGAGTQLHHTRVSGWLWFLAASLPHLVEWPVYEEALRFYAFLPSNLSVYQHLPPSFCSSSLKLMSIRKCFPSAVT